MKIYFAGGFPYLLSLERESALMLVIERRLYSYHYVDILCNVAPRRKSETSA